LRLGKTCEPILASRKRRAHSPSSANSKRNGNNSRLEEKLDDLVDLLRSQAARTKDMLESDYDTPSSLEQLENHQSTPQETPTGTVVNPIVAIDPDNGLVTLLSTGTSDLTTSVLQDTSIHKISNMVAEEQFNTFRRSFIPVFPFIHVPVTMSALEFRSQKPFLWLVIMALTSKMVSQQFFLEETMWKIISRRIIQEHAVNVDLLLGVVCFASWSHYFKKDKPFMTMLSQIAVTLAFELGLQKDTFPGRIKKIASQNPIAQSLRTMEERRTILAVYHLTSA
jgi:hypothetical protein